ncbi:PREDICTED: ankyrin repeat and zinc finger domain-containing protein 1-like [Camelina sativa]|uniref:Ankyrin repeat and zinc finger domain-containing protein 1-like n=1 Tax=Camelina sativa TaxID=90675 RepID=A0ABM0X2F2_CAMSA|nr:PREDICTED: ankyrin repeat and zinc finger domain-containing protein 1-like [Camelina sativa]
MATTGAAAATATATEIGNAEIKQPRSIFDLPADFFDSCRLSNPSETQSSTWLIPVPPAEEEKKKKKDGVILDRWTCNTCKIDFSSLQDQRSHFKSDLHRLNIKLSVAGKPILREEDVDELTSESVQDYDVSSISGSEDEAETRHTLHFDPQKGIDKKKLFIRLQTGDKVSIWKSLIMDEAEMVNDIGSSSIDDFGRSLGEIEVTERLRNLIPENTDHRQMSVVLLASGGHFAGTVFNGKSVVAHKTFHRYVVRAKAGKKQSTKDGSGGRSIHSAGASLRRYNELALKKDIQELLASWKPYFDGAACVFVHAPSSSRQLLFNGGKPYFSSQNCAVRNVPFTIRRPTFKESQRIYNQLTQIAYVIEEIFINQPEDTKASTVVHTHYEDPGETSRNEEPNETSSTNVILEEPNRIEEDLGDGVTGTSTPLHEAAKSGDFEKVLELLEEGMDPCAKDERGRTPYMLANEKEVRNTFRRFMASNLEKWNWHDAKVPSPLTKEMEESQAAKQAEKDAKQKARAKELKKLRRAREKKAQAEAAQAEKEKPISKVEEVRRAMAAQREKRAAAAERRMASLNIQSSSTTT